MNTGKCYYCRTKENNLQMLKGNLACTMCVARYEKNKNDPTYKPVRTRYHIEEEFKEKFKCVKCKTNEANVKSIATTGDGISRLMDLQLNEFIVVTCRNCGYSEIYDLEVLDEKDNLTVSLDFIFGS